MFVALELGNVEQTTTIGALRLKFFNEHRVKRAETIGKFKPRALNPISLKINPKKVFNVNSPTYQDTAVAVYYKGYLVFITCSNDGYNGFHKLELFYRNGSSLVRLGACSRKFFFLKKKEMRKVLRIAIKKKLYFAQRSTELEVVILNEDDTGKTIRIT